MDNCINVFTSISEFNVTVKSAKNMKIVSVDGNIILDPRQRDSVLETIQK